MPAITVSGPWDQVFHGKARTGLEQALPAFILPHRWFGAKARDIQSAAIADTIPMPPTAYLVLVRLSYSEGKPDTYFLPMAFAREDQAEALVHQHPQDVIARLQARGESGILYDAVRHPGFCQALLDLIEQGVQLPGARGDVVAEATSAFPRLCGDRAHPLSPTVMGVEQSNTSIRYDQRLILKMFRRLEAGTNPDLEIGRFLTEQVTFDHIAPVAGTLLYHNRQPGSAEPVTLAILQGFVPNQGDAWRYTLDTLAAFFDRVSALPAPEPEEGSLGGAPILQLVQQEILAGASEAIDDYLGSARLLGRRTAQLHLALASEPADPDFAPEPLTPAYQQTLYQDMCGLSQRVLHLLRRRLAELPKSALAQAEAVLAAEDQLRQRFHTVVDRPITALRTRIHGDYHLGQVLYTGRDFVITDFEGEPARTLEQRRQKRSTLQDVAGMLRSFHYAAYAAYFQRTTQDSPPPGQRRQLEAWTVFWQRWVSVAFLQAYLETAGEAPFMPNSSEELKILLNAYLLEKAVYELGYELNNRPDWVRIPLQGILQTLGK